MSFRFGLFLCLFMVVQNSAADVNGLKVNVSYYPPEIRDLVENSVRNITVQCVWNVADFKRVQLVVTSDNEENVALEGNSTFILDPSDLGSNSTVIQLKGIFLGKAGVSFSFETVGTQQNASNGNPVVFKYPVGVVRQQSVLDQIFVIAVSVMVGINTIGFGCSLDLTVVKEILKKPIAPVIGFLCQYTIMPLTSYALGKIVRLPPELAIGLFVIGSCPGGGASNVWTVLLEGDLNLSLTMTFFSVVAALGMLPLWLYTLGVTILETDLKIPFENIATSLITLVVPCIVGVLINRFLPKVSKVLGKLVKPASLIIILFILTFGTYVNLYIFEMLDDWRICVSGLLLPYVGMILSGAVGLICRQPWTRVKTIMFETAVQSTGLAILIAKLSLPQPDADLAAVMPVAHALFLPFPMVIWYTSLMIYRKCCKKSIDGADVSSVTVDETIQVNDDISLVEKDSSGTKALDQGKVNKAIEE